MHDHVELDNSIHDGQREEEGGGSSSFASSLQSSKLKAQSSKETPKDQSPKVEKTLEIAGLWSLVILLSFEL